MAVSAFDLFKIGIGPSSSHTVGPMRAARMFAVRLAHDGLAAKTMRVKAELYGSLGATGKGHGSDKAVLLGLAGHEPDSVDVDAVPALLQAMRDAARITLAQGPALAFDERNDLVFHRRESLPFHANGMRFTAFDAQGAALTERTYYSVGGGFVVSDEVAADGTRHKQVAPDTTVLPHPFHTGAELLARTDELKCSIAEVMRRNERHWRDDAAIDAQLDRIWQAMQACVARGIVTPGVLPGGFKVRRRAPALHEALTAKPDAAILEPPGSPLRGDPPPEGVRGTWERPGVPLGDPLIVLDWVNLFALAVNEE